MLARSARRQTGSPDKKRMTIIPVTNGDGSPSSNVKGIGYEPGARTMGVQFKSGDVYHFADVSPEKHAAFMASESKGKHFHKHIRGKHESTKVS